MANPTGADIVAAGRSFLGIPYLYGGTNPNIGLDCSGLIVVACHKVGISAPRTSEEQFAWGIPIPAGQEGPGDLVFFVGDPIDPPPGHVGIVVTPGRMINAPHTGTTVREDNYSTNGIGVNRFMGFRRIPHTTASPTANASIITQQPSGTTGIAGAFGGVIAFVFVAVIVLAAIAALVIGGIMLGSRT